MPDSKLSPNERVEKFTGRLLRENERALKAWEKQEPNAGERARASKLTPTEARARAEQVARRNEE